MHLANSGRVIVRLSTSLPYGQILCDEKSVRVAKVTEMIGPVTKPYASAISLTNSFKNLLEKRCLP
jgi:RNA-binding protein